MSVVNYKNLNQLGDDASTVKTLVSRYMEKLERHLPYYDLLIYTKLYKTQGRPKYSFTARVESPDVILKSDASGWDLKTTVHKLMKALENEMEHRFKTSGQHQEKFHPKKAKRGTDTHIALKQKKRTRI